jgi:hypothetical protein
LPTVGQHQIPDLLQTYRDNLKFAIGQINTHINNVANPHSVTAEQVGLGNVTNLSAANMPISTLQAAAINSKQDAITVIGSGNLIVAPDILGDSFTAKPISDFATSAQGTLADAAQPKIANTGFSTSVLLPPQTLGGAPGTKLISDFATS